MVGRERRDRRQGEVVRVRGHCDVKVFRSDGCNRQVSRRYRCGGRGHHSTWGRGRSVSPYKRGGAWSSAERSMVRRMPVELWQGRHGHRGQGGGARRRGGAAKANPDPEAEVIQVDRVRSSGVADLELMIDLIWQRRRSRMLQQWYGSGGYVVPHEWLFSQIVIVFGHFWSPGSGSRRVK